jgi:hypothetical protein
MIDEDFSKVLDAAIKEGVTTAIKRGLGADYQNPLSPVIKAVVASQEQELQRLLTSVVCEVMTDPAFVADLRLQVETNLSQSLVKGFDRELAIRINSAKSDPVLRGKIIQFLRELPESTA